MNFLFVSYYFYFYQKVLPQFLRKNVNLTFSDSFEKATQLLRTRNDYNCVILHYNPEDYSEIDGISLLEHLILTGQTFRRHNTEIVSISSMDDINFFERVLYANSTIQGLTQEQEVQT